MKILIVLLRLHGGVGTANKHISDALRKKGHKVDILSREDHLKKYSLLKGFLPLRRKIKKLMKERNYDIIYAQDYSTVLPLLLPYPLFWKKLFYCSIGVKWKWGIQKIVQDIVGKTMGRKTIVIFDHNKKRFPKAHLVYRGVNLKRFKPLGKKREYFGWIDKFSEQVSSERYKKIAKEIGLKPLPTGVPKKKSKSIDKAYGKKIVHALNIPHEEMNKRFYNKCKVFINLATPDAGFNLSWLEAMAAGVPIIIGNNEGAGPIMSFDKILDEKEMEKRVKEIIKNPKKINYRKWVIDNDFTWENAADKLLKIFEHGKKNT